MPLDFNAHRYHQRRVSLGFTSQGSVIIVVVDQRDRAYDI